LLLIAVSTTKIAATVTSLQQLFFCLNWPVGYLRYVIICNKSYLSVSYYTTHISSYP